MTPARALLEMRGMVKAYGSVRANDGIDLTVRPGSIVGLLGENGSGKSTLMKVLFGMTTSDQGGIVFKGRELSGHLPADAIAAGIGMVHQHFMLVEAMSVLENVMLGWPEAGKFLRKTAIAERIREASARYGLDLDPTAIVESLSLGARQRVEILKALLRGVDLLILDEPTSNLSPPEVGKLLAVMRRLKDEQRSVVFISHKLGEVLEICDDIVVLRDGRTVGQTKAVDSTRESLALLMVGRQGTPATPPPGDRAIGKPLLVIKGLDLDSENGGIDLRGVDLQVRAGEILAIVGVDGNGQRELTDAIAGLGRRPSAGGIAIDGHDITRAGVQARVAAGLAYIPSDRAATSLVPSMSVADNLMLRDAGAGRYAIGPWLRRRACVAEARRLMQAFDIRASSPRMLARQLSGGNQQKIVVAREVDRKPRAMVALQPTWGLDPVAARFVLDRMLALRDAGSAVLYVTAELEEGMAIGDYIGVMFRGRLSAIMPRQEATPERIGLLMATGCADAGTPGPSTRPGVVGTGAGA
jgi:ABC-type uncharacterized transport system ATPase subunit